ncbi:MAG: NAD(P)/FAD-dependent oxidoreductase [Candidatus Omnitrophota bacterium]|nr:NAD(P)/FAD-dependent oxidoreductase [Candidatus Omnitrophota bacterium]
MEKIEITVVGAGVVGLAVALELSKDHKDIYIIEAEDSFGRSTSSRNSEVIHAGIYYPKDSLKARTCTEGRRLLYDFCAENQVAYRKTGKLIVAVNDAEAKDLAGLLRNGRDNGVDDLKLLSREQIKELEPNIQAKAAIFSPSTGIVDSHGLMKTLAVQFAANNGSLVYNTRLTGIDKVSDGYYVTVEDKSGEVFKFFTRIFINSTGLNADKISALAGLSKDEYKLKYCKGDYIRVHSSKAKLINRLIYPVPKRAGAGLGIHATLDLAGGLRLGPDDEYVQNINYDVDPAKAGIFYESIRDFLPFIDLTDLSPDMAGIRPKLQGPGEGFRDFIIKEESQNGFPGFINLIGIESPGLTGALSIAGIVGKLIK